MNYMGPQLYVPGSTLRRSTSASAADTRKRSLPSSSTDLASSSRHSFAARKSESDRDLFQQLVPVGVAFMEPISLDIAVTKDHADVRYVMNVHHTKTNTTWKHARSFDEYRRFQHKLLKTLNHGHFCNAECPWLFTFLKSYFPKKHLFHFTTARVIAARREALQRFFVTLQTFLLNKANHSCSVVAHGVVNDVVEFVYGSLASYYAPLDTSATTNSSTNCTTSTNNQRNSFIKPRSSLTTVDDDDTSTSSGSTSCISPPWCCQLCESSLEGAAYATTRSGHSLASSEHSFLVDPEDPATSISASAPATCSVLNATSSPPNNRVVGTRRSTYYVTTLGCGHQFHDECIVPKLNETLRCPTCDHLEVK